MLSQSASVNTPSMFLPRERKTRGIWAFSSSKIKARNRKRQRQRGLTHNELLNEEWKTEEDGELKRGKYPPGDTVDQDWPVFQPGQRKESTF